MRTDGESKDVFVPPFAMLSSSAQLTRMHSAAHLLIFLLVKLSSHAAPTSLGPKTTDVVFPLSTTTTISVTTKIRENDHVVVNDSSERNLLKGLRSKLLAPRFAQLLRIIEALTMVSSHSTLPRG